MCICYGEFAGMSIYYFKRIVLSCRETQMNKKTLTFVTCCCYVHSSHSLIQTQTDVSHRSLWKCSDTSGNVIYTTYYKWHVICLPLICEKHTYWKSTAAWRACLQLFLSFFPFYFFTQPQNVTQGAESKFKSIWLCLNDCVCVCMCMCAVALIAVVQSIRYMLPHTTSRWQ